MIPVPGNLHKDCMIKFSFTFIATIVQAVAVFGFSLACIATMFQAVAEFTKNFISSTSLLGKVAQAMYCHLRRCVGVVPTFGLLPTVAGMLQEPQFL